MFIWWLCSPNYEALECMHHFLDNSAVQVLLYAVSASVEVLVVVKYALVLLWEDSADRVSRVRIKVHLICSLKSQLRILAWKLQLRKWRPLRHPGAIYIHMLSPIVALFLGDVTQTWTIHKFWHHYQFSLAGIEIRNQYQNETLTTLLTIMSKRT